MSKIICRGCSNCWCEVNCQTCGDNDWEGKAEYNPDTTMFRKYVLRYLYCKKKHCSLPLGDINCPKGIDLYRADFEITGNGVTIVRKY